MAAVTSNTMQLNVSTRSIFPNATALIDDTISFVQGDLLYLDETAHLIKPLGADADSATFLGVAPVTIVDGKYPPAYLTAVDASVKTPALPGPQYGSVFTCVLKAGDAINPGDEVYADIAAITGGVGNGVTVTQAMGAVSVGVYQGKALTAATGGTPIGVLIKQNLVAGV